MIAAAGLLGLTATAQDREVDDLLDELKVAASDSLSYNLKFNLIQAYANEGNLDSAVQVATLALKSEYTQSDQNRIGQINYTLAYAYDINDQLSSALTYYERAKEAYSAANNEMWIAGSINAMGTANYFAGEYGEALKWFFESLQYAEKNDLVLEQVESLINIAAVYDDTDRTQDAISNTLRAVQLQKELGTTERLGYLYIYLSSYYQELEHFDSVFEYLEKAEALFLEDKKNPEMLGSTYTSWGSALLEMGDTMAALEKFTEGYPILQKNRADIPALLFNLRQQASIALANGNGAMARELHQQALNYTANSERLEHRIEILKILHQADLKQGDLNAAYVNLSNYTLLSDSIRTRDRDKVIAEMQAKYELREQEKQLEIQGLKIDQERKTRILLMVLASLLLVSVIGLLLFLRGKNRTNRQLAQQKSIIENALQEKEVLLKEIHHRVKNNLQVISSLLSLQAKSVDDGMAQEVLKEGQARVRSMALIHQNLYQGEDLMTVNTEVYFPALIQKLLKSYSVGPDRDLDLQLDIESLDFDVEKMVPLALIMNELVSNSLKHAFKSSTADDKISVFLAGEGSDLILRVQDNGVGIKDISEFSGKSFGYRVITAFARKMKAEINYLTNVGFGVEMRIPNFLEAV